MYFAQGSRVDGRVVATNLSEDHKPDLPAERRRIEVLYYDSINLLQVLLARSVLRTVSNSNCHAHRALMTEVGGSASHSP